MQQLRVSIVQTDIIWENKQDNLRLLLEKLQALQGTTEIVVLPEMFSTGFSMNSRELAEPISGVTIQTLRNWTAEFKLAIAGSFICKEQNLYFNRGFFLTPEGREYYYDKRHLFRMGQETEHFAAGDKKVIIPYLGWNICLLVCYDLRFPVWSRNVNNEYDMLLYVASWPQARQPVWDTLLRARALENMCYVCGVNRVGTDGNDLRYNGGSLVCSPKGKILTSVKDGEEGIATVSLDLISLQQLRSKFPVWQDADTFQL